MVTNSLDPVTIVERCAHEGIPTAAIARVMQQPFDEICEILTQLLGSGQIAQMPKADWPPGTKWLERVPSTPTLPTTSDIAFRCKRVFKLTAMETGILSVLLRCEWADKDRLHQAGEQQRLVRGRHMDSTDPKIVDVMVCKMRKKLKAVDDSLVICTNHGNGYYLDLAVKQKLHTLIGAPYAEPTNAAVDN